MAKKRAASREPARPAEKITKLLPKGYDELLGQIKEHIRSAQLQAGLAVNRELVVLYWHIGRDILSRQEQEGWGTRVIDRLAGDLRRAYPDMSGLSPRNLKYMRTFAEAWSECELCSNLLHKFLGSITASCSTRSKKPPRSSRNMPVR